MSQLIEKRRFRIAMAQINTTVGDFSENRRKILKAIDEAKSSGVDLITFPELAVCGYPPEDLLFKSGFIDENIRSLEKIIEATAGITAVVGFVDRQEKLYNAAAIIHNGKLAGIYHKICLPNYGVFDENRYFQAGSECITYTIAGVNIGINICEDIWEDTGPTAIQAYSGAEVIVNISASPYHYGKGSIREKLMATRARDNTAIVAFNNLVGGQDELVFDGGSLIFDENGQSIARGKQFAEDLIIADLAVERVSSTRQQNLERKKELFTRVQQGWQSANKITISAEVAAIEKPALPSRDISVWASLPRSIRRWSWVPRIMFIRTGLRKCWSAFREDWTPVWWRPLLSMLWVIQM